LVALPANGIANASGFPSRLSPDSAKMSSLDVMWDWACPAEVTFSELAYAPCNFGKPWAQASTKVLLWGDSHAQHLTPIIQAAISALPASVVLDGDCPAALGGHVFERYPDRPEYPARCADVRARAISLLKDHPEINLVVLSAAWRRISQGQIYHDQ